MSRRDGRQRGFTLLELLVAMAIFAVLAVMAYSGLHQVLSAEHKTAAHADRLAAVQRAVMVMSTDIRQMAPRTIVDAFGEREPAVQTMQQASLWLEFTAGGHMALPGHPGSSLQRVAYSVEDNTLIRRVWVELDRSQQSKPFSAKLLDHVDAMKVRFLSAGGQWREQWPPQGGSDNQGGSASVMPRAVEVTLQLHDWGKIRRLYALPAGAAG